MIADRLLAVGGAKVTGALAVACIVLTLLLGISVYVNVLQVRGKAKAVGEALAQLAASEASAKAEIASCAAINTRQASAVTVLETELLQCRGQQQETAKRLELAFRQRDRARTEVSALEQQRRINVEALAKAHETDCNRPLCRALSDELLGPSADRPPE